MKHFFLLLALVCAMALPAMAAEPAASLGYEVKPWPAGQKAPELRATALDGKVWALKDLRGRAVLVNFWASWCEPCRAEMPSLQALAQLVGRRTGTAYSGATVFHTIKRHGAGRTDQRPGH